jgi:hypothetical protein
MVQVVEELYEINIGGVPGDEEMGPSFLIKAFKGKRTEKFYGLKIIPSDGSKTREIWFSDLNQIAKLIEKTGGKTDAS